MTGLWYKQSASVNDDARWASLRQEVGWQTGSGCLALMVVLSGWCKNHNVVSMHLSLVMAEGIKWGLPAKMIPRLLATLTKWGLLTMVPGEKVCMLPDLEGGPLSASPPRGAEEDDGQAVAARQERERVRKQAQREKAKAAALGQVVPAPACPTGQEANVPPVSQASAGHVPPMSQGQEADVPGCPTGQRDMSQAVPGTGVGQGWDNGLDDAISNAGACASESSEGRGQRSEKEPEKNPESPGQAGAGQADPGHVVPGDSVEAPSAPKAKAPRVPKVDRAAVDTVLGYWATELYPKRRPIFDKPRRAIVEARLADFTPEQLCRAVDGVALSDWHMGRDPKTEGKSYRDIGVIFRNAGQVEKFLELADQHAALQAPPAPPVPRISPHPRGLAPSRPQGPTAAPTNAAGALVGITKILAGAGSFELGEIPLTQGPPPRDSLPPLDLPRRSPEQRAQRAAEQRAALAKRFPELAAPRPEEPSA